MKTSKNDQPRLISSGFVALDIVIGIEDPLTPRFYGGGTTGNVTAALSYLGWQATPISRLSSDEAGDFVKTDLERWGVDTTHLAEGSPCPTPIVVEKIFLGKDGAPKHRFFWTCPDCGAYFPSYRPVLAEAVEHLKPGITSASAFFTDRVSRSTLALAEHCKSKGAVVIFEPSGVQDPAHFVEMLRLCDVLKYSDQRAKGFSDLLSNHEAALEIQTLGAEGLRFLLRGHKRTVSWVSLASYDVKIKDTAGAGDWTSAGLIHQLFSNGRRSLRGLTKAKVTEALAYGQALAALNCQFEGARGAMYQLPKKKFVERVTDLQSRSTGYKSRAEVEEASSDRIVRMRVCPSCLDHETGLKQTASKRNTLVNKTEDNSVIATSK
jgi:sugar/nucleoside kinase (ribokinase family)